MRLRIKAPGDVPGELWSLVRPMTNRGIASVLRRVKDGQSLHVVFKNSANHTCGYILPVRHKGRPWGRRRVKKYPGYLGPVRLGQGTEILAMIKEETFEGWSLHDGAEELGTVIGVELN